MLFVADNSAGIRIIDISNIKNIRIITSLFSDAAVEIS